MKFSSSALGALGASFLLASGAGAIDLVIDDPSSIKTATKAIIANLRAYYTGDKVGDTPGNLPDPYYWWECGAMFNSFIDYWYYTGDDTYNTITIQAMQHQIGDYNAFMPPNQTKTLGNDDQAFWGMAAMAAAENKFPDPTDPKQPSWLSLAQAVFNTQVVRWDTLTCGGGLRWQIFTFNNGYDYKNTISNGCFFNIAARLAKYTGNTTYSDWAEKMWDWELSVGLMSPQYHYFDGTDDKQNCTTINHIQWTYNAAVHMAGAAAMWNLTGDDTWRQRLTGIINSTDVFFNMKDAPNVMFEVACENNGKCDVDQRSFKAYLARFMGYTIKVAPFTSEYILPKLTTSALAAAKQCNAGADQTSCGLKWTQNGVNDGSFGVGEQMAALEVMQVLLYDQVAGPVSEKTGGTSKSDPSAGTETQNQPITFNSITTGDKAGAGFITTLVLIGIIGGAWWMVS
ncbi:glycoside hydrolase family 76 protein [Melanomma pulvis-pyrius CBS 109.77]|uniref:Mannan endo-1,6-alpha-mannosidase n=1 Tax=Melanomma pulvis-pyrius CBS 109.77 TaxID=1314802 RepID=A0A6A6XRA8_9PLEO|nr:glycoside hydrolase family 76 protein [Melanomma pulvis-pyrius CBS 109.77]